MELDTLFGLPAHPLMVHIPVVIIPLSALIAVVFAFKPSWLDRFGWGLVALTGLGALGGILAAGSGEQLEEAREGGSAVGDHAEMGEAARNLGLLFFLVVLGVMVVRTIARRRAADDGAWKFLGSRAAAVVMSIGLVLTAAAATATVSAAGHSGAKLVWRDGEGEGESEQESDDGQHEDDGQHPQQQDGVQPGGEEEDDGDD